MSTDDRVGAHHAVLDAREMHRASLAFHEAALPPHQLAQHRHHGSAARERVMMPAVGAEGIVVPVHRRGESGRDRLLSEREMARALYEVLQEQIVGALLAVADLDLQLVQPQPCRLGNGIAPGGRFGWTRLLTRTHGRNRLLSTDSRSAALRPDRAR